VASIPGYLDSFSSSGGHLPHLGSSAPFRPKVDPIAISRPARDEVVCGVCGQTDCLTSPRTDDIDIEVPLGIGIERDTLPIGRSPTIAIDG
jgi:hypothetical protein